MSSSQYQLTELLGLIERCREERDMNKKIDILYHINSVISKAFQITLPSFLTDDYIDSILLYYIEQSISSFANYKKSEIL
jgi:hypothetical protein